MNIKEIKEMLQLMAEHGLNEIEIEKDGMKIKLKKGPSGKGISEESAEPMPSHPARYESSTAFASAPRLVEEAPNITVVKSPMVGTFYAAPGPDQPPYVSVGAKVKEGDVLCIIEAMKLMNEIKSEMNGTVIEVLVKNGQPVEFDQPFFKIQKG